MRPEPTVLHDPTAETSPVTRPRRPPPDSLEGKVVALLDIGKTRSDEFLDHVEALLGARGIATLRAAKATNAKPAPVEVLQRIATEAHVVVEALAD